MRRRALNEPLETKGTPQEEETAALDRALEAFAHRQVRDDFTPLTDFLLTHPHSVWADSLQAQLGDQYYHTGHFSKALEAWEAVWEAAQTNPGIGLSLSAQHAVAELSMLYARLGRMDQLRALFKRLEGEQLMSVYRQKLKMAADGLWKMENEPGRSFRCGPLALDRIRSWTHPTNSAHPLIFHSKSTTNGFSLTEVANLSKELGMNYQMAFRTPKATLIVPSVVHWKVGHYAAIIRESKGLFLSQDPTFINDTWVSEPTLDEEASGYFLVPPGKLPPGWRPVPEEEARNVRGKGATGSSDSDATGPYDMTCKDDTLEDTAMPDDLSCHGMPAWDFNLMLVNQRISDTPIGYRPPLGPPIFFRFVLNAEDNWTRNFPSWWGTTLGLNWTCNWGSFVEDDPFNPSANLRVYIEGGWLTFVEDPSQPGIFRAQKRNPGYIQAISTNAMTFGYIWAFPDGTKRIYGHLLPPGATNPRFWLMSLVTDAQGNSAAVEYDDNYPGKITGVVDALGQRTTLEYGLTDPGYPPPSPVSQGNVQFHWQVTRITDPFGRSASFQYQIIQDGAPPAYIYYLSNATDVVGMSSQFSFYPGWAVSAANMLPALTTPYGTTHFRPVNIGNRNYGAEITDPDGNTERLFYFENAYVNIPAAELLENVPQGMMTENDFLNVRSVAYWNKKAYAEGFDPNDYSKALIYHFTHTEGLIACGPLLESIKAPLENRVWFNYPGQGAGWVTGTDDRPSKIGRVLDDGTTQAWQFQRDLFGNATNIIDPMGRNFTYIYSTNGVDLLEMRMTRNGQNQLLWHATYNGQHLPLTTTDASGQTYNFNYNARGQLLAFANPKNETTSFGYDTNGYLIYVDGPLPGTQDRRTFTYDFAGRIRTATDQDGYTVTIDYDNLDRITKLTFPDGTYQEIIYDRLKPGTFRDREGRITTYTYNSVRQLASLQDPLGRVTQFQWCRCGGLEAMIDPLGRMTSWQRDVQNRVIAKRYADGSTEHYEYERTTGRLRRIRDELNQITELNYFADDTLHSMSYPNALIPTPTVSLTYDADYPRIATMRDGEGTTIFSYNPILASPTPGAGRLATVDGPWANDTVSYGYDDLGRVISRSINGTAATRVFDPAGRLVQMTNALGSFTFSWEGGSRRLSHVQYPNGTHSDYTYFGNTGDRLLQRMTHSRPDNSILSEFTYQYNPEEQITNWTQLQGGTLTSWAANYDSADRLTGVTASQGGTTTHIFSYGYDAADNRTSETVDSVRRDYAVNALNQLSVLSNSPLIGLACEWDAANRLVAVSNGNQRVEFSYDGFGRRIRVRELTNGIVSRALSYVWCGNDLCEERTQDGSTVLRRFFPLGQQAQAGTLLPAGTYFHLSDHLTSLRELLDSAGTVRAEYAYEPFGSRSKLGGDLDVELGFNAYQVITNAQLSLAEQRAYSPALGRWLSRDPRREQIASGVYTFADCNPINEVDRDGRFGESFSLYDGIGGGLFSRVGSDGSSSAGFELGVGKGGGSEISPLAEPEVKGNFWDDGKLTIQGELGVSMGPISVKGSLKSSSCDGDFSGPKFKMQACIGPICADTSPDFSAKLKAKPDMKWGDALKNLTKQNWVELLEGSAKADFSGKLGVKYEVPTTDFSFHWPWE